MLGGRFAGHAESAPCKPFAAPVSDPTDMLRINDMPVLHPWHICLYNQHMQAASSGYYVTSTASRMGVNVWLKDQLKGPEHSKSLPLLSSTTSQGRIPSGHQCPPCLLRPPAELPLQQS